MEVLPVDPSPQQRDSPSVIRFSQSAALVHLTNKLNLDPCDILLFPKIESKSKERRSVTMKSIRYVS